MEAGPLTHRENWLRTIEFRNPEWIPCGVGFSPITWNTHRNKLEDLCLRHTLLFSGFQKGGRDFDSFPPYYRPRDTNRDNWGCVWKNELPGLEGMVIEYPLADWSALDTYRPPDPAKYTERGEIDWDAVKRSIAEARKRGDLVGGSGERLFDRLYFLRGFENLMMDFATDDPHLPKLIDMLWEHERKMVGMWLDIGVDVVSFHTDIGTQQALMISPEKFRIYLKPMFKDIFQMCRRAGAHVALSSDGCLLEIVDDLIECGVSVHDPQVRACTLDGIEKAYKGKMCINLDLDRQLFPFATPDQVREHVREGVERLALPEGGLMLQAGIWGGDVSLENIEALCQAMEDYCLSGAPER